MHHNLMHPLLIYTDSFVLVFVPVFLMLASVQDRLPAIGI